MMPSTPYAICSRMAAASLTVHGITLSPSECAWSTYGLPVTSWYLGETMLAPTISAPTIGSPMAAAFSRANQGESGAQVSSLYKATNGIDGSAWCTMGSVRQSKLWMSTRSTLPADRTAASITSTNCCGSADLPGLSASTLVSTL